MYRLVLNGDFLHPHYVTTIKRFQDGDISEMNYSFCTKSYWTSKKKDTAERTMNQITAYYEYMYERPNPFRIEEFENES